MVVLWRRLGVEQKVAAVAAVLLIVSTLGPFSFVEAATVLTAGGVLALLRLRGLGRRFHLPGGDGLVIIVAAGWSALLIVARLLDRPLGQSVLALGCAAILAAAGLRDRVADPDVDSAPSGYEDVTEPLHRENDATVVIPTDTEDTRPIRPREPRPGGPPRPR
ncbi:MAG: hypothetical protein ACR2HC_06300 [Thermoleophilaceae bacterium]